MERQVSACVSWAAAFVATAIGMVVPSVAHAQTSPTGFVARHSVTIAAPADRVYDVLTKQVGSWWDPAHTYSGDAKNMSIDLKAGGCFCETMARGGFIEHARVVYAAPPTAFRLIGAFGPLQESGVTGSMTFAVKAGADGTTVQMTYSVGGFVGGPFDAIAPAVQSVLAEQVNRLKRFVETGKPAAPSAVPTG